MFGLCLLSLSCVWFCMACSARNCALVLSWTSILSPRSCGDCPGSSLAVLIRVGVLHNVWRGVAASLIMCGWCSPYPRHPTQRAKPLRATNADPCSADQPPLSSPQPGSQALHTWCETAEARVKGHAKQPAGDSPATFQQTTAQLPGARLAQTPLCVSCTPRRLCWVIMFGPDWISTYSD